MDTAYFRELVNYNYWARDRILDAAQPLTPDQLAAPMPGNYSTLRSTLVHTMWVEWLWLSRLQGSSPMLSWNDADYPTVEAIAARWREVEPDVRGYVEGLTDQDLMRTIAYTNTRGLAFENQAWQLLVQMMNHGTQHRAEAALQLTAFSRSPGDLDFTFYLRSMKPAN
jgi:uncharacterized damage-inducible protein DinB